MEITPSLDRYTIMEHVSEQTSEFRMTDIYYLLKELEPEKWQAKDIKVTLEWLADMGLAKRNLVKVSHRQKFLFYQACYDHEFLLIRTELLYDIGAVKYKCYGFVEK